MWYFAWALGVSLACTAGILNGMWLEMHMDDEAQGRRSGETGPP
ncbi:MAG: cytochrome bd-I oxidase subunit CydX [Magnetospirillum sp.]|nr:cytochrome bd-I oxidase subunit CydX [Magnetospirillum sp.]